MKLRLNGFGFEINQDGLFQVLFVLKFSSRLQQRPVLLHTRGGLKMNISKHRIPPPTAQRNHAQAAVSKALTLGSIRIKVTLSLSVYVCYGTMFNAKIKLYFSCRKNDTPGKLCSLWEQLFDISFALYFSVHGLRFYPNWEVSPKALLTI